MQITRGIIPKAQKIVIYGPEGIGKTTFASKFPDAVFIDTEGGSYGFDVARLPGPSSWVALGQEITSVRDGDTPCRTLVIDTADWAEHLCEAHILASKQISSIEDPGYGKGYTYVREEFGKLLNRLSEVTDKGITVVLCAHAIMRKFEQPDELGSYDRWELKLSKQVAPLIKEWADAIIFANYKTFTVVANDAKKSKDVKKKATGARRCMYLTHHPCWDAKNRWGLSDDLDDPFEFDYDIIRPFIERNAAKTQQDIPDMSKTQQAAIAAHDTYYYHPESECYFVVKKGEPLDDHSEEISKEQYDSAIKANSDTEELNRLRESHMNKPKEIPQETKPAAPKSQTFADAAKEPDVAKARNGDTDALAIPQALKDLMMSDNVAASEIQSIVGAKGYFPADMSIEDYPDDFIDGCLVAAWPAVLSAIISSRATETIPFN